jgi:hypothetical protein
MRSSIRRPIRIGEAGWGPAGGLQRQKYEPPFVGQDQGLEATISNGLQEGLSAIYVGAGNKLYADTFAPYTYNGVVAIFNPPYSGGSTPTSTITYGLSRPSGIIVDHSGKLYIADASSNLVNIYTPPFTGSTQGLSQTITSGIAVPEQLAFDSAGNLYVANQFAGVTIYAPPYSGAPQSITNGVLVPLGVAVQPGTLCSSRTKMKDC